MRVPQGPDCSEGARREGGESGSGPVASLRAGAGPDPDEPPERRAPDGRPQPEF